MFSMTDVFIDDIAVAHLKGTYFGAMGFSGIGAVIGPWFGAYFRLLRVSKWICSIFSASYIFNCSVSSTVSYERFIEKKI